MTDPVTMLPFAPLPTPLTSFIGREQDIAQVCETMRQAGVRLVTLTGPGGVGKTRLALRVADRLTEDFPDGVVFVPLAPITDPDLVGSTIMQAIGIREGVDQASSAILAEVLGDRQVLLILDNFEQIVEAAPQLTDLLAACPNLRVLVTSRIVLRLSGEFDFPIRPLPLPAVGVSNDQRAEAEAIRLFADRARAAHPTFAVSNENVEAVAAICHRLDGLPLALELVAANIRVLPPQALLPRLAKTLPLLRSGRRDDPARLQTMHDAIAWSYHLLPVESQAFFSRLAIFAGGFTLEAAAAVAGEPHEADSDIFSRVASLVEQSLVHQSAISGMVTEREPRFGMLETIREFGLECLEASETLQETQQRHAEYFLTFAEEIAPGLVGARQQHHVARLATDLANFRAALAWFHGQGHAEAFLRLAGSLKDFWYLKGLFTEGRGYLESGLALPGVVAPAVHAKALAAVCSLADWQGDYDHAVSCGDAAVALWRMLDDHHELAGALRVLSLALIQVDNARSERVGQESLDLYRALGDDLHIAETLDNLGVVAYARADYATAAARMEEGLPYARAARDLAVLGASLGDLGHVCMVLGDFARTCHLISESLTIYRSSGEHYWIAWCLACLAGVAAESHPQRAAMLFGAAAVLREAVNVPWRPSVQAVYQPILARIQQALGDTAFDAAWRHGETLSLEDAITEGFAVVAEHGELARLAISPDLPFGLSPREAEVLRLVAAGHANREIADALFISVPTVKRHVSTILGKLDVPSRPAAVAFAHTHGLA